MNDKKNTSQNTERSNEYHLSEAAEQMINEGIKLATKIFEESKDKFGQYNDELLQYTEQLTKTVRKKPVTSLLVTGGVVFLLVKLFKR